MKKLAIAFCLILALASVVLAQTWQPLGSETLSVPSTGAVSLSKPIISGVAANAATLNNTGTTVINYWFDGTTPTTSTGQVMYPGDTLSLETPQAVRLFKGISSSGTGALSVMYFR